MTDPRTRTDERPRVDLERNRRLTDRLARERFERLRGVARSAGVDRQLADDVVQAALVGVLRAYRGPAEFEQIFRYTARAVQNEAATLHRRRGRKESRCVAMPNARLADRSETASSRHLADPEASDPLELAIDAEELAHAAARVRELPPLERAVIVLGAAGFSPEEIAKATGRSKRAVRKRVTRANRLLREKRPGPSAAGA